MKWMHPECGEVEVNPQNEADERALRAMGLTPVVSVSGHDTIETPADVPLDAPKPRRSRKG